MRILVCATEAPMPPVNGHRLQLIHLFRQLAQRHEIRMLAFREPNQVGEPPPGVALTALEAPSSTTASRAARYLRAVARGQPTPVARVGDRMRKEVEQELSTRSFDVVHVTPGILAEVAAALGSTPAILATLDAWHLNVAADALVASPALRPLFRLEERRVRRYAASAYRPFERVVLVSEEDARACRSLDPSLAVDVVPNGVDAEEYAPNPQVEPQPGHIVFTGTMEWAPNVTAAEILAREVLPRLREARPEAHLSIVGRRPRPQVLELGALDGVRVTGEVPDVRDWLWGADVYACPMVSGTGVKNKLLEALACGKPCVATRLACQGTGVRDGRDLLVADEPPAIADALLRLLDDADLRARLGQAGRDYVVEQHSWAAVARRFERIYEEVTAGA